MNPDDVHSALKILSNLPPASASDQQPRTYLHRTKVSEDGIWLEHASAALRNDRDVVLAAVLSVDPFDAVAKASVELLQEADFVLELVKETKAPWQLGYMKELSFSSLFSRVFRCCIVFVCFSWMRE